jgi:hypothetical protein
MMIVHNRIRLSVLIAFSAGAMLARAGVIEPTPLLPPPNGFYNFPVICIPAACAVGTSIHNFVITMDTFGANEDVETDAILTTTLWTNVGGFPGSKIGPLTATGSADFTFFGRTGPDDVNDTFPSQITDFDFTGTFGIHTFEMMQNPNPGHESLGSTTISDLGRGNGFLVSSFFDVFSELKIDSGPFVPGPPHHTTLGTPEPASAALAILGLAALVGYRKSRVTR